jgi:hypothetical protein
MFRFPDAAFARLSLAGILGALVLAGALAQDDSRGDSGRGVRGDGRGMATFGDRNLTSFGDRFNESFADRGLTSFSDIPLAPMGGLELPSPSDRARAATHDSAKPRRLANHHPPRSRRMNVVPSAPTPSHSTSIASIRGIPLHAMPEETSVVMLPPVRLPVLVLDHRPALDRLEAALQAERKRARERGDLDAVRALGARLSAR